MQKNRQNGFSLLALLAIGIVVLAADMVFFYFEQEGTQLSDPMQPKWPAVQYSSVRRPELQVSELPLLQNKKAEEELEFAKLKLGIEAKYAGSVLTTQQKNRILVLSANKCLGEDCRAYGVIIEGKCVVGDVWINPDADYRPSMPITDCWTNSCAAIEDDDVKNFCLALIEKDYDRCSRLATTDGLGQVCFGDAYLEAVKNGDKVLCDKIAPDVIAPDEFRSHYSLRSLCYKAVAKKNNDINICANIINNDADGYQKKLCFGHVLKNNRGGNICGQLSEANDRELCLKTRAETEIDPLEGDSFLACLRGDDENAIYSWQAYWQEADCAKAMKEATKNAVCAKRCAENGFGKPALCSSYNSVNDCCCENAKCAQKGEIADETINQDCCNNLAKVKILSESGIKSLCVKMAEQNDGALCDAAKGDADCASGYGCDLQPAGIQSTCKSLPSCVAEGQPVNLYREILAKTPRCCAGMTAVALDWIPNGEGKCAVQIESKNYACVRCGDGVCGDRENKCNCAKDCSEGKDDYWLATSYLGNINLPKNECRVFFCHGAMGLSGETPVCNGVRITDISFAGGFTSGRFVYGAGKYIICSVVGGESSFSLSQADD